MFCSVTGTRLASAAAPTPKGRATRETILRAAAPVFAQKGYALTRMSDVFEAIGMTKGAVYFHFDGKATLARAVLEHQKQLLLHRATAALDGLDDPVAELAALVPQLLDLLETDDLNWLAEFERDLVVEGETGDGTPILATWTELVADILRRGRDTGQMTFDDDPVDVAAVAVGGFHGVKIASLDAPSEVFRRRAQLHADATLRAVGVDPDH